MLIEPIFGMLTSTIMTRVGIVEQCIRPLLVYLHSISEFMGVSPASVSDPLPANAHGRLQEMAQPHGSVPPTGVLGSCFSLAYP